jgi:2Fe-2S ferredoxin
LQAPHAADHGGSARPKLAHDGRGQSWTSTFASPAPGESAMPKITVLPHPEYAPAGTEFVAEGRISLCDALLDHGVALEHACGKVGACTTCHVIVRQGYASLNPPDEDEEDMLDRAWGLEPQSRLSCQAIVAGDDLVVEIPMYSINLEKEKG